MSTHEPTRFFEALRAYLPALAAGDPVPLDVPLRTLGLNSMRAVDLLIELEGEFDVTFPDEALTDENFETAATLLRAFERLTAQSAGVVDG